MSRNPVQVADVKPRDGVEAPAGWRRSVPAHNAVARPLLVSGVAAVAVAVVGLRLGAPGEVDTRRNSSVPPVTESPAPPAMEITPGNVVVVRMAYQPGESSGWHVHPGLHAVAVLSGSLTVYDHSCNPRIFGPGDSYVGGQELHLARNAGAEPVDMVVTTIDVAGPANSVTPLAAPAKCSDR
jgi:quercetin dioxygenase-like cupin family protein